MDVVFKNSDALRFAALVTCFVEVAHLLIAWFILKQPQKITNTQIELAKAQRELQRVKSVQVELVRHSKLKRRVIACEKELEKYKDDEGWRTTFVVRVLNAIKFPAYGFVLYTLGSSISDTNLMLNSSLFWPLAGFSSGEFYLPLWATVCLFTLSARYLSRAILPAIFPSAKVPNAKW